MTKRMLPFLVLALTLCLFAATDASASCLRCSAGLQQCVYVNHPGWYNCTWIPEEHWCDLQNECEPFGSPATAASFATDYRVVSVERLDEAAAPQDETRTASLDAQPNGTID